MPIDAATASVLDQMVGDVTQRKQAMGTTLTPVGTEKRPHLPNDVPGVFMSNEQLQTAAADLRKQAKVLLDIAAGLDVLSGDETANEAFVAEKQAAEVKAAEREADRRVADKEAADAGDKFAQKRVDAVTPDAVAEAVEAVKVRMDRISAEAQARVFGDAPAPEPERVAAGSASADEAWTCPDHGDSAIVNLTSKRGRKYRSCKTCNQFQKER